ncbi:beta-glucanase [Kitasatospora sp. NPDC052896]|uniref:beta-glucanase n=1 Tax=Kitasatospora sp. NPDC052896 TaxID=3364061 RepID=UPI0037C5681D
MSRLTGSVAPGTQPEPPPDTGPTSPTPTGPDPAAGRATVFTADFGSARQWMAGRTSAYPRMGPTNRSDHKLDHLTVRDCSDGVFAATPRRGDDLWDCDLLTTEGSPQAFQVRAGDVVRGRFTLPTGIGAWPALWTWRDGDNEVDLVEYHPDHPAILELSNHLGGTQLYWNDPSGEVAPGATIDLTVVLGAHAVTWYVNGSQVFADQRGVGTSFSAYLIINMSVSDGTYHPRPDPAHPGGLSWTCHSLTVLR